MNRSPPKLPVMLFVEAMSSVVFTIFVERCFRAQKILVVRTSLVYCLMQGRAESKQPFSFQVASVMFKINQLCK